MNTIQNKERFFAQYMVPGQEFILKEEAYYEDTDKKDSMGGSVKRAGFIFNYDYEKTPNAFRYGSGVYPSKFIGRSSVILKPISLLNEHHMFAIVSRYCPSVITVNISNDWEQIEFDYMHGDVRLSAAIDMHHGYSLDYLRKNGFSVSWLGVSVSDQLKYEWIKYRD